MRRLKGIAASPGIAAGPIFVYQPGDLVVKEKTAPNPAEEWQRFKEAAAAALADLGALREMAAARVGESEAAIFDAHQMIVMDPDLEEELKEEIDSGASAEAAVETVIAREVATFEAMADPMFRERAADFADVGRRLLRLLLGVPDTALESLTEPAIVVARDLLPSDTAQLDKSLVRGFCTVLGGPLSHTAVLARNLGLPAVVGAGEALLAGITAETWLIVDGTAGLILVDADEDERSVYEARASASEALLKEARIRCQESAVTLCGQHVEVVANVGLPGEEIEALASGAEGIGLLRTEFLFVDRATAPGEEEQLQAYRPIVEAMGERPLIARTLDIGGDKPAPYLDVAHEDNPFLGWRAIRIGLDRPELLKTQLRALLRAGHGHNLKIMLPMVSTVEEMEAARAVVDQAQEELTDEGHLFASEFELGTMIEVPSAALMARHLARHVDFFSIGSNDLTQYTLAADRGNPAVGRLFDCMHPAVFWLIKHVIDEGHAAGIWVGLCGEMASDPQAVPILLGLGLDEFSMGAAAIPQIKALLRLLTVVECQELAEDALDQPGAPAVRELVSQWMAQRGLSVW